MYILNVKVQGHVILFTQLTISCLGNENLHYIVYDVHDIDLYFTLTLLCCCRYSLI